MATQPPVKPDRIEPQSPPETYPDAPGQPGPEPDEIIPVNPDIIEPERWPEEWPNQYSRQACSWQIAGAVGAETRGIAARA